MPFDYSMYKNYVCSRCFHQLTECTCECKPDSLIHVDEGIQEHVRILNEKGFYTMASCEGHYDSEYPSVELYILFARDDERAFPPPPSNFVFTKNSTMHLTAIRYNFECIKQRPVKEAVFEKEKADALHILLEWIKDLEKPPYLTH